MEKSKSEERVASKHFFADEEIEKTITTLEEQLSDELDTDDVPSGEGDAEVPVIEEESEKVEVESEDDAEVASIMAEADALLASLEKADAETPVTEVPDEKEIIAKECAEVEAKIAEEEKKEEVKTASEEKPGIEDKIGDEAHGGDPSVSELPKTQIDCATDKEVFPTNSEYVASITKRLDRVANILEKRGMKRLAFRVDQLSDKLESSVK